MTGARRGRCALASRPAAGERLHVRPSRPAGTHVPRRSRRGVGRAVVLRGRQELGDEDEQHHLPCRLRVRARPAARAEGDDEQEGGVAPHHASWYGAIPPVLCQAASGSGACAGTRTPERSSTPVTSAPTAKIAAAHQNAVT
jgi:hypothetical protein